MSIRSDALYDPPSSEFLEKLLRKAGPLYTVGLKLGVPTDQLDDVDTQDQRREMLDVWLQSFTEEPSWGEVAATLARKGFSKPAEDIRKRYGMEYQWEIEEHHRQ